MGLTIHNCITRAPNGKELIVAHIIYSRVKEFISDIFTCTKQHTQTHADTQTNTHMHKYANKTHTHSLSQSQN